MSEQTVVPQTDPAATPADEAQDAPEQTLDQLLAEFDPSPTNSEPTPPTTPTPQADPALAARLEAVERELASRDSETAIANVIKNVRGDLDPSRYSDRMVRGWLSETVQTDQRIQSAFQAMRANPAQWQAVEKHLTTALANETRGDQKVDAAATDDREAVAAAVRASSTASAVPDKPVSEKDLANMSDEDFFAMTEKIKRSG